MIKSLNGKIATQWSKVGTRFMPFADVATPELPLGRLLRLALFQVSVGMAAVLIIGTLNRVMIVELGVPAWVVACMVSLPLVFAPFRTVIGFRSDNHRSVLGWKRVPYLFLGSLAQFGGLAIMPFALIVLSGDTTGPAIVGQVGAALAFLLLGAGMHTVQTVGLALATDLAPKHAQSKVVVMMSVMLLAGMVLSALAFGLLLANFSELRLIKVIQGAAMLTMVLNLIAIWKQEPRNPARTRLDRPRPPFRESWATFTRGTQAKRRLLAVGLGTAAFSMEDILLEPYGGQVLHLSVSATTTLTALLAVGGLCGFALSAWRLPRGADPYRIAAGGLLAGLVAFCCVIFAGPTGSAVLFGIGTSLIGFGASQFEVGMLMATIRLAKDEATGLAIGAWGAAQASAAGLAIASGGLLRDGVAALTADGSLGEALQGPATGYAFVYHLEILLLFVTLVALGKLVRAGGRAGPGTDQTAFTFAEASA